MQKIIKIDRKVIVMFEDGSYCERCDITEEEFQKIVNANSDEEVFTLMCPEFATKRKRYLDAKLFVNEINSSNILVLKGESVYWEDVSELSMPAEFVKAVLNAESNNDELKLTTYKNFWTLMSLNPDERCRKNLFWFLNKNDLVISKCGFFVAYRNADLKHIEPDGSEVFTDAHTHTFSIKIGEIVTMPREQCDEVQENTCSRGLHLGSKWWLTKNYYGKQGLVCLCNPADVVAVPQWGLSYRNVC